MRGKEPNEKIRSACFGFNVFKYEGIGEMKKASMGLLFGLLLAFRANAAFNSPETMMTGAQFGNMVQDVDGICYVKMWDTSGNNRWIWFDSTTPVGIAFFSELQLAYSKEYTGMTVTYDSTAAKNVPGSGESVTRRLTSLKL